MRNKNISVLNELIAVSQDGEKGFSDAAGIATDPRLKGMFQTYSDECQQGVIELQALVRSLGGETTDKESATGTAHRGWVCIDAASKDHDLSALADVEREQNNSAIAYQKALDSDIDPSVSAIIEIQAAVAKRNHQALLDFRQSIETRG